MGKTKSIESGYTLVVTIGSEKWDSLFFAWALYYFLTF